MLRRTAVLAAGLALATAGSMTGCSGDDPGKPQTPEPTPITTPTPSPTAAALAGLTQDDGWEHGSCRPGPGEVLLQYPFRAVTPTRIEDVGVYPGDVPVQGAWVTPAGQDVADLVSAVDWPEGFGQEPKETYRWADRKEAVEEVLAPGRYHLFVLAEIDEDTTLDGLDIAWVEAEGDATGALQLDHRVTVGKSCA